MVKIRKRYGETKEERAIRLAMAKTMSTKVIKDKEIYTRKRKHKGKDEKQR